MAASERWRGYIKKMQQKGERKIGEIRDLPEHNDN